MEREFKKLREESSQVHLGGYGTFSLVFEDRILRMT